MRLFVRDHEVRDDGGSSGPGGDRHFCVVVRVQRQVRDPVDRENPDGVGAAGLEMRERHARLRDRRRRRQRYERGADVALDLVLSVRSAAFVERRIPGQHQGVRIQEPPGQVPRCRRCPGARRCPWVGLSSEEAVVAATLDGTGVQRLKDRKPLRESGTGELKFRQKPF